MSTWDEIILLDAQSGATSTLTTQPSLELSPDYSGLTIQVNQSGTASTVVVQASVDNSMWHTLFSLSASTTLHAVTQWPRYLRVYTTGTADSHVIAKATYRK